LVKAVVTAGAPLQPRREKHATPGAGLAKIMAAMNDLGLDFRQSGGQFTGRCPASGHLDEKPSFGFAQGAGKAVMSCQTGCHPDDLIAGLGLAWADLFDEELDEVPVLRAVKPVKVGPLKRYPYPDAHGVVLFEKLRQDLSDGDKLMWTEPRDVIKTLARIPLYRYPELLAAVRDGKDVVIAEGEKCVDALVALGVVATTNFDGASRSTMRPKWRDEYNAIFAGLNVSVYVDNDEAGEAHGRAIVAGLVPVAASVRMFKSATTAPKDDVVDHLAAGFTLDQMIEMPVVPDDDDEILRQIREQADIAAKAQDLWIVDQAREVVKRRKADLVLRIPPTTFSGVEYMAQPDPVNIWAVEDLLPFGGNATITATYKSGKTTIVGDLIKTLADNDGRRFMEKFAVTPLTPGERVGLFNYELDSANQRRWLRKTGIRNEDAFAVWDLRGYRMPMNSQIVQERCIQWLRERNVKWWVIDPFARAFVGSGAENSNEDVGLFLDTIDFIKQEAGVDQCIMPLHTGREVFDEGLERGRGAVRLDDWPDSRWIYFKEPKDEKRRFFRAENRENDVEEEQVTYDPVTHLLRMAGPSRASLRRNEASTKKAVVAEAKQSQVVDFVRSHQGEKLSKNRIIEGLGWSKNQVTLGVVGGAIIDAEICLQPDGGYGIPALDLDS
jgi:hypothetical protein